jgi:hypothetical protein
VSSAESNPDTIDDAMEQIRTFQSNGPLLEQIQDHLTQQNTSSFVPFVGAGLTIPCGMPGWKQFLLTLSDECGERSRVESLLAVSRFEEAADVIEDGLSPAVFHNRVTTTFGRVPSSRSVLSGAILALPSIASGAVVTTNFDGILERIFSEAELPFDNVVWGAQVDIIREAINDNRRFLLEVHGDAQDRTHRVLTQREYEQHFAEDGPNSLRAQLRRLFEGRRVLFIGCSLAQDRTMSVLAEAAQRVPLEHFAIVERPLTDVEFFNRQQFLGNLGIIAIWYPPGRHDLILPLLQWMGRLRPPPISPPLVPKRRAPFISGFVVALLGIAGLLGWYLHSARNDVISEWQDKTFASQSDAVRESRAPSSIPASLLLTPSRTKPSSSAPVCPASDVTVLDKRLETAIREHGHWKPVDKCDGILTVALGNSGFKYDTNTRHPEPYTVTPGADAYTHRIGAGVFALISGGLVTQGAFAEKRWPWLAGAFAAFGITSYEIAQVIDDMAVADAAKRISANDIALWARSAEYFRVVCRPGTALRVTIKMQMHRNLFDQSLVRKQCEEPDWRTFPSQSFLTAYDQDQSIQSIR